ncbi:MAG: hypothetical protein ACPHZC_04895, partial [Flavobacteriaceae bacterium]
KTLSEVTSKPKFVKALKTTVSPKPIDDKSELIMIEDNTGSLFDVSVDSSSLQETRINRANKGNNK